MKKIMSSFVQKDFLPDSNIFNALVSNSTDMNYNELTDEEKGSIDIQIATANVNKLDPYNFTINFYATTKDENKKKSISIEVVKDVPNSNGICRIDYNFTIED